jgi:hypothetical protein
MYYLSSECPHPASPSVQLLRSWPDEEIGCDGSKDDPRWVLAARRNENDDGVHEFYVRDLARPDPVSARDTLCRAMRRIVGHYNETLAHLAELDELRRIWESEGPNRPKCDPPDEVVDRQWDHIQDIVTWAAGAAEHMLVRAILVNCDQAKYNGSPKPGWQACGWRQDDVFYQVVPDPNEDPCDENGNVIPPLLITIAESAIDYECE